MSRFSNRSPIFLWSVIGFCLTVSFGATAKDSNLEKIESLISKFESRHGVPVITAKELMKLNSNEVVIVDAREPEEHKISMIPGAISLSQFEERSKQLKDKKIIPYCTIGYRSGLLTKKLIKRGFKAFNLRGSILLWVHSGGSLVDQKGQATKKVHVYGPRWNLLPKDYEAIVK